MVAKTVDTYGRIDTLINNAGGRGEADLLLKVWKLSFGIG